MWSVSVSLQLYVLRPVLGTRAYPQFQKALEELVSNRLNFIQRMEVTYGRISQSEILMSVLQSDIEKIKLTMEHIDQNALRRRSIRF